MHTTTRLALQVPDAGDSVSTYPTVSAQQMATLDNSSLYTEGTVSARPAASAVEHGHTYYATDTGLYYRANGAAWTTALMAGAWQNISLAFGLTSSGGYTPSARLVGDLVFLRGQIVISNVLTAGSHVGTLSSAYAPASIAYLTSCYPTGSATTPLRLTVSASGGSAVIATDTNGGAVTGTGLAFALDGLFYSLS